MMIKEKKVGDHWEIWVDGEFWCSCDNPQEIYEEKEAREWEQSANGTD